MTFGSCIDIIVEEGFNGKLFACFCFICTFRNINLYNEMYGWLQ